MKEDWLGNHVTTLLVALSGAFPKNCCLNSLKTKYNQNLLLIVCSKQVRVLLSVVPMVENYFQLRMTV